MKHKNFIVLFLIFIEFISSANASDVQIYENKNWGFAISLPRAVRYETSRPPNPNHGFQVHVSRDSCVWVTADSSDDQSLPEAVETQKSLWGGQGCREVRISPSSLAGRLAEEILLDCPVGIEQKQIKMVSLIVALQAPPGIGNATYTIGVSYLQNGKDEQSAISTFNTVRQGFQFTEAAPKNRTE